LGKKITNKIAGKTNLKRYFLVIIEVISNTNSKLKNPYNFNYLSKFHPAHLIISLGTHVEKLSFNQGKIGM
jgi:hypothetical protein